MQGTSVHPKLMMLMLGAILGLLSLTPISQSAGAQETTTLTIHERICYANQRFDDPFANCHDNVFGQATEWDVLGDDSYQTAMTDASTGNVTFSLSGTTAIIIDPWGADPYFYDYQYFCAYTESGEPIAGHGVGQGASGGISIEYAAGSDITCDWYLYAHPSEESPTPTPAATSTATGPVTTLPSTGSGASITSSGANSVLNAGVLALFVAVVICIVLKRKVVRM